MSPPPDRPSTRKYRRRRTEEELDRFEHYRRSHISRIEIGKLLRDIIPPEHPITHETLIVVGGLAKLYVGDLVRLARRDMDARSETGPITPQQYVVAARKLQQEIVPCVGDRTRPRLDGPPIITRNELL